MAELVTLVQLKEALTAQAGAGARTAANLSDERLQAVLDDAHAEVLGKIRTRYTVPTDPATTPGLLKGIILAVAAYVGTLEWMQGKDLSDRDAVVLRYNRAQSQLKAITDGTLDLELETPAGGGSYEATSYTGTPAVGLTDDVAAPTYYGMAAGGWQGGGLTWG